jgi:hypothetical protein
VGAASLSAAPNITGTISSIAQDFTIGTFAKGTGAFQVPTTNENRIINPLSVQGASASATAQFDASKSQGGGAYGQTYLDGTPCTEVHPNHIVGIWIIRANGAFLAANSSFDCLNSDAGAPGMGKSVQGGTFNSRYTVAGNSVAVAFFRAVGTIGASYAARIGISTNLNGQTTTANFDYAPDGSANIPTLLKIGGNVTVANMLTPNNGTLITPLIYSRSIYLETLLSGGSANTASLGRAVISGYATSTLGHRFEIYVSEKASTARRSNLITFDVADLTKGTNVSGGGTNPTTSCAIAADVKVAGQVITSESINCGDWNTYNTTKKCWSDVKSLQSGYAVMKPDGISSPGIYVRDGKVSQDGASNQYINTLTIDPASGAWVTKDDFLIGSDGYCNGIFYIGNTGGSGVARPKNRAVIATDANIAGTKWGSTSAVTVYLDAYLGSHYAPKTSDERIKHDINDISDAEAIGYINAVRPVTFVRDGSNDFDTGLIAQEVQKVKPELVHIVPRMDDGKGGFIDNGLSLGQSTGYILKALQNALARIEELESKA